MLLVGLGMQSAPSLLILTLVIAVILAALFAIPAMLAALAARWLIPQGDERRPRATTSASPA